MNFNQKLQLYSWLDSLEWLKKSYTAKIMLVSFLGIHVPLLTLLIWFVSSNSYSLEIAIKTLLITLLATLAGTAVTLYALNLLLTPVILTSATLRNYVNNQTLPKLPTKFADEVGTLMADSSQTLHQLDELIHHITNYNNITGLPNQNLFSDHLQWSITHRCHQTLSPSHYNQTIVAVMLLAINDFSGISHISQPEIPNLLLRQITQRLITCITSKDILAHLDRDEFVIALMQISSVDNVITLSQLLQNTLAKPFSIEGQQIYISVNIGITIQDIKDYNDVNQLLQQAQISLYQAKQQGRNQNQFYSPEMNAQLQERLILENELYEALKQDQMLVYYQPIINLYSKRVTAVEALVRWQHPTRGLISPAKFIPIAEANGLIVPIDKWVLRTACAQNRAWQLASISPIRISVNLSGQQFEEPNLVDMIQEILHETGLEPCYLELEVTESFLIGDIQQSVKTLKQLQDLGILLALDDFGTGYSSLNYLKRLPVNFLKIDRSFVQDVTSNADSATVTDAIIALAKSLRLKITAEGVETEAQMEYLLQRGCDEGQGFYFRPPIPAEEIFPILNLTFPVT